MTPQNPPRRPATDALKPMSPLQARQTRAFIDGLASEARPYWDMVEIGDELSRDLHLSA